MERRLQFLVDQFRILTSIFLSGLIFVSCSHKEDTLFTKLDADDTGVDFINKNHETELSNILTYEYFYNGGGVALGDINNDGRVDMYFTSNIFPNKLYLNQGNFKFKDITESSGTQGEVGWKTGVTMADVNGDGLLDIYVCRSASPNAERRRNILYINNGDLTFTNHAKEHNLDDSSYSTQAAFFDFDRDGDLDVFLLNHSLLDISNSFNIAVKNSNVRFPDVGNKLLRNDNGYFRDVSDDIGVFGSAFNYGLGVSLSDINNDGWIDMYTGCDYTGRDKLLINESGKSFTDVTYDQLSHISKFTMGTDIADINGDGQMDILTLDMLPEDNYRQKQLMGADPYDVYFTMVKNGLHSQYMRNMLHLNNGDGTFSEIGQWAGISNTDWSWGGLIQDYDNDGIQDIFISNGFKRDLTNNDFAKYEAAQEIGNAKKAGKEVSSLDVINQFEENKIPNYIFKGNGDLTYTDVTSQWGFDNPSITNGIAYADLDNDGDLDMVTNNMNEGASIYRNNSEINKNNYLAVQLKGSKNKFGVGSRVTVFSSGRKFVREQLPVRGFQSSVDNKLNFGLGTINKIDSVCVRWSSGNQSTSVAPSVNTTIVVSESDEVKMESKIESQRWFSAPDTILSKLKENDFIDFNTQPLLPRMYSTQGPALACGDVNKDGAVDIYVGGPKGRTGKLFIQDKLGSYVEQRTKVFDAANGSEDIDALFFDMDHDGDLDLFVVSGGYEFLPDDNALNDFLYENDGQGNFKTKSLPSIRQSGSCVRAADVDLDGDLDLFIGGRIVPGRYPEMPESYILVNDGKGNFKIDDRLTSSINKIGMVTDAQWIDLNQDKLFDLIVVGEWMPIKVFINENQKLIDRSENFFRESTSGFWNALLVDDFDKDEDLDLVVGNCGLNNQLGVSKNQTVNLYYSDYDNNGSIDPILDYKIMDRNYPYPSRDELLQQLPVFKKRFTNYSSYSKASITEVLTPSELSSSQKLTAVNLTSCYFKNDGDHFVMHPLSNAFQFAPIFAFVSADLNNDGMKDLVSGGNLSGTRARTGKLTGNYGIAGIGNGQGEFTPVPSNQSGLCIKGDVRHMIFQDNNLFVAINNEGIIHYKKQNK